MLLTFLSPDQPNEVWTDGAIAGLIGQSIRVLRNRDDAAVATVVRAARSPGGIDLTIEVPDDLEIGVDFSSLLAGSGPKVLLTPSGPVTVSPPPHTGPHGREQEK